MNQNRSHCSRWPWVLGALWLVAPFQQQNADSSLQSVNSALRALSPDETRVNVGLGVGEKKRLTGQLKGFTATVYAISVHRGEQLRVSFQSKSQSAYFNIINEADPSGAALFIGQINPSREALITVAADGILLLQPYLIRAVARRNQSASYGFDIELHAASDQASPSETQP